MVCCAPYCSGTGTGTPFKNFGTHLGVQYTRLKSTDLTLMSARIW